MKSGIVLIFSLFLIVFCSCSQQKLQDGDIIFQSSTSQQSKAIEIATNSPYSHCGIVFYENGEAYVYEAVQPVGKRSLEDWIASGVDGKYKIKRLKDKSKLTPEKLKEMRNYSLTHFGKNYDGYFNWSDKEMYCSELVWKIYKVNLDVSLAKPLPLKEFNIDAVEVRKVMQKRYGNQIPYDELMISPAQIFQSPLLEDVE